MLRMLKTGGRCSVIVPDGVLFGSSNAHKQIRQEIIENHKLDAVISMPSGVFKPYAGVSTAVLFFTKTGTGGTDKVWFYDMQADGYSLDDKRAENKNNDIPDIISRYTNLEAETDRLRTDKSFLVPFADIKANDWDLSINKYKEAVYEELSYTQPSVIIQDIKTLQEENKAKLQILEDLLK
jgi:type I restriction enzyme M protein